MAENNKKIKSHKFDEGSFLMPDQEAAYGDILSAIYNTGSTGSVGSEMLGLDPISLAVQAGLAVNSAEGQLIQDWSRSNYKNMNPDLVNALFTDENTDQVVDSIGTGIDFSNEKNNVNLANSWNNNNFQETVQAPSGLEKYGDYLGTNLKTIGNLDLVGFAKNQISGFKNLFGLNNSDKQYNDAVNRFNRNTIDSFYDTAQNNQMRNQRQAMFAEGGSLDELNGVVKVGNGNTHEQNPYDGVQMGIAPDNLPNLVEEGEIVYNDYVYSNRLKPSKSLLKQYNLPEKYAGKSFAEIGDKLQKESEDRPNDPISKTTLDEWMLRLQNAQEDYKAKAEERRLARIVNSMSDEEKAALLSSLEQPMAQQEGIDLSQPMYAKGGKIHIAKNKRGTFTAAAKKRGMGVQEFASKVLANPENYTEAMRKKAQFAHNAKSFKHADGGHLFSYGGDDNIFNNSNLSVLEALADKYPITNNSISDYPSYLLLEGNTQTNPIGSSEVKVSPYLEHYYDEPNMSSPIWKQGLFTNNLQQTPVDYVTRVPYKSYPEQEKSNRDQNETSKGNVNLAALRYAPAIGAQLGAITAALQPKDYTLSNRLEQLASEYKPIGAPHIGGYRRYTPYDVNLGDAENLALQAAAINANRGQNRATQGALNTAVIAKSQEANAKRNLAAQQANEANRLAVDTYNLGIDQFNAQRDSQYDQLNQQILANRINLLGQAAQAADASRTAWAANINSTAENAFNQLGNVGRDEWNRLQMLQYLKNLGYEGIV